MLCQECQNFSNLLQTDEGAVCKGEGLFRKKKQQLEISDPIRLELPSCCSTPACSFGV